jgi:hypothetical protein
VNWLDKSMVVVNRGLLKEYFDAPEDTLSFLKATADYLQVEYIYHDNMRKDDYHLPVVRQKLTQNIAVMMPDVVDEIESCFNDEFPMSDGIHALGQG